MYLVEIEVRSGAAVPVRGGARRRPFVAGSSVPTRGSSTERRPTGSRSRCIRSTRRPWPTWRASRCRRWRGTEWTFFGSGAQRPRDRRHDPSRRAGRRAGHSDRASRGWRGLLRALFRSPHDGLAHRTSTGRSRSPERTRHIAETRTARLDRRGSVSNIQRYRETPFQNCVGPADRRHAGRGSRAPHPARLHRRTPGVESRRSLARARAQQADRLPAARSRWSTRAWWSARSSPGRTGWARPRSSSAPGPSGPTASAAAARPELEALTRATGETSSVEMLAGDETLILDEVQGGHLIGTSPSVGTRWPAHATSTGKVLLAAALEHEPDLVRAMVRRSGRQAAGAHARHDPVAVPARRPS